MKRTVRVVAAPPRAATADSPARSGPAKRRRNPSPPLTLPQPEQTQRWPELAPAVAEKVADWGPPRPLTAEERAAWNEVEDTSRECVAKAAPPTPDAASTDLWAVSRYTIWGQLDLGTLDPKILWTEHNIEYFVAVALDAGRPEPWCHAMRTALYRVGRVVNPDGFAPLLPAIGRAEVPDPYPSSAEHAFALDVAMPGRRNEVARAATLSLACGAGLQGAAIARIGPQHILRRGNGRVAVRVDDRLIPVREPYTDMILRAARECDGDRFVPGINHSSVATVARRIKGSDGRGLLLRRARTTWLVAHLVAPTPLAALRKFTGPLGGDTLTALLEYASDELDPEEALEMGWGA